MPSGDGTGPNGEGAMTGRGLGLCNGYDTPGFTKGRGMGRGRGLARGRGRGFRRRVTYNPTVNQNRRSYASDSENVTSLKNKYENLKTNNKELEKRIGELEKKLE